MIIVNIFGGLGNQLFQYAFARALQEQTTQQIFMLTSELSNNDANHNTFRLNEFCIDFTNITVENNVSVIRNLLPFRLFIFRSFLYTLRRLPNFLKEPYRAIGGIGGFIIDLPEVIEISTINFHSPHHNRLYLRKHLFAFGNFQSESFFHQIKKIIKKELAPPQHFSFSDSTLAKKISSSNSVAVHIRRGDYVTTQDGNYHLVCNPDWYERAINKMQSIHPDASFYFFSDDPDWVKDNIKIPKNGVVVDKTDTIHDFNLMRLCRHFIISNSSYSWWAQWLCDNDRKTVIAPDRWFSFNNPDKKYKIYDNQDWIILET